MSVPGGVFLHPAEIEIPARVSRRGDIAATPMIYPSSATNVSLVNADPEFNALVCSTRIVAFRHRTLPAVAQRSASSTALAS
jgi:hypothetical protein